MSQYVHPTRGVGIGPIPIPDLVNEIQKREGHSFLIGAVLPDWAIRKYISIEPFTDYGEHNVEAAVSYGLTSAGYDLRVGYEFNVFTNALCATVHPKKLDPKAFLKVNLSHEWVYEEGTYICSDCGIEQGTARKKWKLHCPKKPETAKIPPNSFALAGSMEMVYIPRNVSTWCTGKSTYARCGINMNFTPFEPAWWGHGVTVEIINATPLPVEIIPGQGIGQAQFFLMAAQPERDYSQKKGAKYQGQRPLTLPNER